MAWHIVHGILEQVRVQSTFPGKIWIIVMFLFRIVVVARIGDMVYHDEQSSFLCNTMTPGCNNVCFNRFSPISQLRYWSLMVLVVSTPSIMFFLYATHRVYHANVKYPFEEDQANMTSQPQTHTSCLHQPSLKRRRDSSSTMNGFGSPNSLYEVTTLPKTAAARKTNIRRRRHQQRSTRDDVKSLIAPETVDSYAPPEDVFYRSSKYPVFVDAQGRRVEFIKEVRRPTVEAEAIQQRKFEKMMLQHPELARAYWWHVLLRTILEVVFLVGQYLLYGWTVSELYECDFYPCPKVVECWVSRPQEKTCLLWLMYGLGFIAVLVSLIEFWSMGLTRLKIAFVCCGSNETKEEKRRRLAKLEKHTNGGTGGTTRLISGAVSLDSLSSATSPDSV